MPGKAERTTIFQNSYYIKMTSCQLCVKTISCEGYPTKNTDDHAKSNFLPCFDAKCLHCGDICNTIQERS